MESNNITIIRGDTPTISVTVVDSDGDIFDLTSSTAIFTVKESRYDSNSNAVIGPESMSITDPEVGVAELILTSTQTDLRPLDYWYDITVTDGTYIYTVVGPALFTIKEDVTK